MSSQSSENIKSKKGFTLVEVLIVLVIISIMTGLLITVIDPVAQRNRARDGTIIASANKIVATIAAFNSATGVYPSCDDLMVDLQNEVIIAACGTDSDEGTFQINGVNFPTTCGGACGFRYERSAGGATACLEVRFHAEENLNDDDADLGGFLLWTSTGGRITDETSSTCSL